MPERELVFSEDPFVGRKVNELGNSMPEDLSDTKAQGYGRVTGIKGKGSPFKARDHYPRVRRLMVEKFGGFFWNCDRKLVTYSGQIVDQDLLGFMDIQGVSGGKFLACNVTTKAAIGAHLRDYTSPSNTYGQAKLTVYSLLLEFLRNGGEFWIYGAEKIGSRWRYEAVRVTEDLLETYVARKRK